MKHSLNLTILLFALAPALDCQSQVYYLDTPLTGGMTIHMQQGTQPAGWGMNPPATPFSLNLSRLTETITIDVPNATARQQGYVSFLPGSASFSFHDTQTNAPVFPNNQPSIVSGDITVNLIGASGGFHFDTGTHPVTWDSTLGKYFMYSLVSEPTFTLDWAYTLATGGATYSGTFTETVAFHGENNPYFLPLDGLSMSDYPSSIEIDGSLRGNPMASGGVNFAAPNGFNLRLHTGIERSEVNWGGPRERLDGFLSGPVTAVLIPEPSSSILVILFSFGAIASRRRLVRN